MKSKSNRLESLFNKLFWFRFVFIKEYVYVCNIKFKHMKELEDRVFRIIGVKSKSFLAKELKISKPTLDRRIVNGGWLKSEIDIINKLTD